MKKKFKCEIDCANCAAKMEDAVKKIDGVNNITVNFMMQNFVLDVDDEIFDTVLEKTIKVVKKVDSDFEIIK